MKIYVSGTSNLGDFLNSLPVLSGVSKKYGKYHLIIKSDMRKFIGLRSFLNYQNLFSEVEFDDELFLYGDIIQLSSWPIREDKNNPNRPTETCRYENWLKDKYQMDFEVDDEFVVKTPEYTTIDVEDDYYVGDRWSVGNMDTRRESHILSYLKDFKFIDFGLSLLENAYIIKNLKKPLITNFTGVGMLADLCNVPLYCVWKAEDWKSEFRVGNDISWDNGKNIQQIYEKHFYLNRKSKLVHANDLQSLL
jgi:hypothetical protein